MLYLISNVISCYLYYIIHSLVCSGLVSGLFSSEVLFLCQYKLLNQISHILLSGKIVYYKTCFYQVLVIFTYLFFQMQYKISFFQAPSTKPVDILIEFCLKLQIHLQRMRNLLLLSLVQGQDVFFHLIKSLLYPRILKFTC